MEHKQCNLYSSPTRHEIHCCCCVFSMVREAQLSGWSNIVAVHTFVCRPKKVCGLLRVIWLMDPCGPKESNGVLSSVRASGCSRSCWRQSVHPKIYPLAASSSNFNIPIIPLHIEKGSLVNNLMWINHGWCTSFKYNHKHTPSLNWIENELPSSNLISALPVSRSDCRNKFFKKKRERE